MSHPTEFDYEPLRSIVTKKDLVRKDFLTRFENYRDFYASVTLFILGASAFIGITTAARNNLDDGLSNLVKPENLLLFGVGGGVLLTLGIAFFIYKIYKFKSFRDMVKKDIRLERFISANDDLNLLQATPHDQAQSSLLALLGTRIHFNAGLSYHPSRSMGFSVANYSTTTTDVDFGFFRNGQYLVVSMDLGSQKNLPHVFFDALQNNDFRGKLPGLALVYAEAQDFLVSAEFDKHFKTHIVKGSEQDLLYFLTPEIMAVMVDEGSAFDFEIKDNQLFMYAPQTIQFSYEGLKYILELARLFQTEFTSNTKRYRAPENIAKKQTLSLSAVAKTREVISSSKYRTYISAMAIIGVVILLIVIITMISNAAGPRIDPY